MGPKRQFVSLREQQQMIQDFLDNLDEEPSNFDEEANHNFIGPDGEDQEPLPAKRTYANLDEVTNENNYDPSPQGEEKFSYTSADRKLSVVWSTVKIV